MKPIKFVFVLALLVSALYAGEAVQPRATIVDDPPAVVVPAPAPATQPAPTAPAPQVITIQVVPVAPVAPTPSIAPAVAPATPAPVTAQQIEDAVNAAVTRYKAASTANPAAPWYTDLLQALMAGALSLGAVAITWIGKKIHDIVEASSLAAADKSAVEALSAGVTAAENELYQDFAQRNADGSISADDAAALRAHAFSVAKTVATGPGLEALKVMAGPRIHDLIERLVASKQAAQVQANAVPVAVTPIATPA